MKVLTYFYYFLASKNLYKNQEIKLTPELRIGTMSKTFTDLVSKLPENQRML